MKEVLLITDVNFWKQGAGHRKRISSLIEYLSIHTNLYVAYLGIATLDIKKLLPDYLIGKFIALGKKKNASRKEYGQALRLLIQGKKYHSIIIEYIHNTYLLDYFSSDAKLILDTHDIISDRSDTFKTFNAQGNVYELDWKTEAEIFTKYDFVIGICEPDYLKIKSIIGEKALLCPHAIVPFSHMLRKKAEIIGFVASEYLPNKDAINFFIKECWPEIVSKHNVNLVIYGNVGKSVLLENERNITIKGFVPNLAEIYDTADIIINPVRFGAGLKIKNIEALGNAIPLVTTTHGSRGMEPVINKAYLVTDDAINFTKSVISLIDSYELRLKLSKNAYSFMANNFMPQQCYRPLLQAILTP